VPKNIILTTTNAQHATRIARVALAMQPTVKLIAKKDQKEMIAFAKMDILGTMAIVRNAFQTVWNVTISSPVPFVKMDISKKKMESAQNVQIPAQRAMVQPRQTVSHAHLR
jgi:hypothetical protein